MKRKSMIIRSLIFLLCVFFFCSIASVQNVSRPGGDFKYIGADKCKFCHNKEATGAQYTKWAASKHAQAMKSLNAEEAKNPKCIKCHSTYGSVDESLIATLTLEEGVSCESCHGPGNVYKSFSIMNDRATALTNGLILPDEDLCKKCHNAESPNFKGFDYPTYLAMIRHPNPSK